MALRVVAGDRDSFCAVDMLWSSCCSWQSAAGSCVLPGPTIFLRGALDWLATLVETLLTAPAGPQCRFRSDRGNDHLDLPQVQPALAGDGRAIVAARR